MFNEWARLDSDAIYYCQQLLDRDTSQSESCEGVVVEETLRHFWVSAIHPRRAHCEESSTMKIDTVSSRAIPQPTALASTCSSNDSSSSTSSKPTSSNSMTLVDVGFLLRTLYGLALPLAFALLLASRGLQEFSRTYLLPEIDLMLFADDIEGANGGLTYYHRVCTEDDQTTHAVDDLLVTVHENTTQDGNKKKMTNGYEVMQRHGVAVIPDLLSESTATQLREFILAENQVTEDLIYVIANEHRWSFPITVDQHPTVTRALEEMLAKPYLVELLEDLCGTDPAVVEFTAITAAEGAAVQYWHQDVIETGSGVKFGRHFVPTFSLFVPLQNTTAQMGATGICPGTHMCSNTDFCQHTGFQVSGSNGVWPLGAGALVNQQTTHRGEAHTMGPHRAVFILTFAPRPRVEPLTVESRMIGQSGSYSLHWSQWGHTIADFANPTQRMRQPWRAMRSLGLYKCTSCRWGWDYVSSTAMRIGGFENGFSHDDAMAFAEKGGFWFLPKSFQAAADEQAEHLWSDVLYGTVVKSAQGFLKMYVTLFIGFVCVVVAPMVGYHGKGSFGSVMRYLIPVLLAHLCVLFVYWRVNATISDSLWGRNILHGRSQEVELPFPLAPANGTAVLPTTLDVMVFENMQSHYMASMTDVLETFHPGNAALTPLAEYFANGYSTLTPDLQRQIRMGIMQNLPLSRLLIHNSHGKWSEASPEIADAFLHRRLVSSKAPLLGALLHELDCVQSELRFGYWRRSILQRKHISKLVRDLRHMVLPSPPQPASSLPVSRPRSFFRTSLLHEPSSAKASLQLSPSRLYHFLSFESIRQPPHESAWLREGDRVESFFEGYTTEWYAGRVDSANGYRMSWDVQFDDGDMEHGTCSNCVLPFTPYAVNEWIEVRMDKNTYAAAQVMAAHRNGTCDLALETGHVLKGIKQRELRRVFDIPITQGSQVMAIFPEAKDGVWYPAYVAAVNPDGTFAVAYEDGDFSPSVPQREIRLR